MITSKLFPSGQTSAATENSAQRSGSENDATVWVLDVTNAGSWSGVLKVAVRALGAEKDGASAYTAYASIKNRNDETTIDGDTGITAAGIYEVSIAGLEARLEHTRTAGTVRVREHVVRG